MSATPQRAVLTVTAKKTCCNYSTKRNHAYKASKPQIRAEEKKNVVTAPTVEASTELPLFIDHNIALDIQTFKCHIPAAEILGCYNFFKGAYPAQRKYCRSHCRSQCHSHFVFSALNLEPNIRFFAKKGEYDETCRARCDSTHAFLITGQLHYISASVSIQRLLALKESDS